MENAGWIIESVSQHIIVVKKTIGASVSINCKPKIVMNEFLNSNYFNVKTNKHFDLKLWWISVDCWVVICVKKI